MRLNHEFPSQNNITYTKFHSCLDIIKISQWIPASVLPGSRKMCRGRIVFYATELRGWIVPSCFVDNSPSRTPACWLLARTPVTRRAAALTHSRSHRHSLTTKRPLRGWSLLGSLTLSPSPSSWTSRACKPVDTAQSP